MMTKLKDKKADLAVREFVRTLLLGKDRKEIQSIRLYGSALKGAYKPLDSDIDLLVVGDNYRLDEDILDLETKVSLKYGVMLSVLFNTPGELRKIKEMGYAFGCEMEKAEVLYERH